MADETEEILRHFRTAFQAAPAAAYRDWFRLQEELGERDENEAARALAEDLWSFVKDLTFPSAEEQARFFHNVAVFFGTPGPAADLARAREAFSVTLAHYAEHDETGWHARTLHNYATALSNLGETAPDLSESVALFDRALAWRTAEREIARGVTLHNMGIALRRLARLDPEGAAADLERSASLLQEAADIRARHNLAEGHALSLFHLALTLESLKLSEEARLLFHRAADEFDALGKKESAAIARDRSAAFEP